MKYRKRLVVGVLTVLAALTSSVAPAHASAYQDHLLAGEQLSSGQYLTSTYGGINFRLAMQSDGNVVFYANYGQAGQRACWATNTVGRGGRYLKYQSDGNLVLYQNSNQTGVVWSSGTYGRSGGYARVGGSDTNFALVDSSYNMYWARTCP